MLSLKSAQFSYNRESVLQFPDIEISRGEQLLIKGKSGSGKTTLMHIIGGLLKPHQGDLMHDGKLVYALKGSALDKWRGQEIGFVFQHMYLLKSLNVIDNILAASYFASRKPSRTEAESLMKLLGLSGMEHKMPHQLSGGEQQRLAIARAIIHKPSFILADEPSSHLDDENALTVLALLQKAASDSDAGLVLISHDNRIQSAFKKQVSL